MAQLWGGRFTKNTDAEVFAFNESLSFDQRLYKQDIEGSIAHVHMLGTQGIISSEEAALIKKGLTGILEDIENGTWKKDAAAKYHNPLLEAYLTAYVGKK